MSSSSQTLYPPSFTLYPLTTQDLKTCYESQHYKIVCTLNGPYYQRKHANLEPLFRVSIANNTANKNKNGNGEGEMVRLAKKVEEVLQNVVVKDKYQRMVFDICLQIIQTHPHNPVSFLLSPLLNLLSYTCALRCLQTISSFACTSLILHNEKIIYETASEDPKQIIQTSKDKTLVLCSDARDKKALTMEFTGQFNYIEFEKMTAVAQEINTELLKFQEQKINEVYDLFHQ